MNQTTKTSSEYLSRAARGDRRAFGEFYELHRDEIYRYIYFRVSSQQTAEDLTGKVFLEAWEYLQRKRINENSIQNFRAWMFRIAHNKVVDHYRSRKDVVPFEKNIDFLSDRENVEHDIEFRAAADELRNAIQQLSPLYQQVVVLRFINQLSHAEVAQILDIREGHARIIQYRALKELKRYIPEVYEP